MTAEELDALPEGSVIVADERRTYVALRSSRARFPWLLLGGGPHSAAELVRDITEDWTVLRRGRP